MADWALTARFDDFQRLYHIGRQVGTGVLDGVAYAGLSREVSGHVRFEALKQIRKGSGVLEMKLMALKGNGYLRKS